MQIQSIRLADGRRVFRVFDDASGLCLERATDPAQPVRLQTAALRQAMKNVLSHSNQVKELG
ncbi:MAG: hypothetical protein ACK56I_00155 [bacterium]